MINISPVGRNASVEERYDYEKYDAQHQIRSKFIAALKEKFPDYGLTYVLFRFLFFPVFLSRPLGSFITIWSKFRFYPLRGFSVLALSYFFSSLP